MVTSMSRTTWRGCTSAAAPRPRSAGGAKSLFLTPRRGLPEVNVAINRFTESTRQVLRTHFQIFRARRGP